MMVDGIYLFLRSLGAVGLLCAGFGGIFPWSLRIAMILACTFLLGGPFSTKSAVEFLNQFQTDDARADLLTVLFPEVLVGMALAIPICAVCWSSILIGRWLVSLAFPYIETRSKDFPEGAKLPKTLLFGFLLFSLVTLFPMFPDLIVSLGESIRKIPPLSGAEKALSSGVWSSGIASLNLAWNASFQFIIPIIAISLAYDVAAVLSCRYVRSLHGDAIFHGVRSFLLLAAILASVFIYSEFLQALREGL